MNSLDLRGGRVWLREGVRVQKGGLSNVWLMIPFLETRDNGNRFRGGSKNSVLDPLNLRCLQIFWGSVRWTGYRLSMKYEDRQCP